MPIHKFSDAPAFALTDFSDAPSAGYARAANKILQAGAWDMARSMTYRFGILNMKVGGASVGVSAKVDERAEALSAFAGELGPMMAKGDLMIDPAKGIDDATAQALVAIDPRNAERYSDCDGVVARDSLTARSAVVAAATARGDLDGAKIAIEGFDSVGLAVARHAATMGATVTAVATGKGAAISAGGFDPATLAETWQAKGDAMVDDLADEPGPAWKVFAAEADVAFVGSKMGVLDHNNVASLGASIVCPTGPIPYTTKATLVGAENDVTILPDFVTTAGSTFLDWPAGESTIAAAEAANDDAISTIVRELLGREQTPVLEACWWAESFISTWQDKLPFGRPFAA